MPTRPVTSSIRQASAWLVVAGGLVLYGALVLMLGMAGVPRSLPFPWWVAQALPPILYAVLVRVGIGRVPIVRWVVATLCLWGAHIGLGAATAIAILSLGPLPVDLGTVEAFPPPAIPEIFWVPLLLVPLRDLFAGRSPVPTRRRIEAHQFADVLHGGVPASLPPAPQAGSTTARPGRLHQPETSRLAPSTNRPAAEARGTRDSPPQAPRERREPAGVGAAPQEATRGAVRTQAVAAHRRADDRPADDAAAVLVRVSFDRVAGQLPPGAFHVPRDRVGPRLAAPGQLLIPRRLVLAQLAEGRVRATWDVVAEQFPRSVMAMTDTEITRHLADGQLVLPLDELVPQCPPDLFALDGPAMDVDGIIESVPSPFQPITAPDDVAPDVIGEGSAEGGFLPDHDMERWAPLHRTAQELEPPPAQAQAEPVACPPRSDFLPDLLTRMPEPDESALARRITTALAPLRPFDVGVVSVEGGTLFTVSPSGPATGAALDAARSVLPLLVAGRAPWPVNQLTIRGTDTVLILTPLGPGPSGRSALLSAVVPGRAVAPVERAALRAAIPGESESDESPERGRHRPEDSPGPDLLDAEVPTHAHEIAASLDALAPVVPSVLRDAGADLDLYLFLPEGSDVQSMGRFATALDRAVWQEVEPGPTSQTVVLRCGTRRLIIRRDHAATGRSVIVVAGGPTQRPGLAYRQVEAAALALTLP